MHGLLPSPVYGKGVEQGIRVPWDAPAERLPDAAGNAPCKGPKGRERAYGVMNYGILNIIKSHSHRILVDTGLTAGRYTKNFRSQSFRNYEDYH